MLVQKGRLANTDQVRARYIWVQTGTDCVTCIATFSRIALLALSVSIELVSSSPRVTLVKSQKDLSLI